MKKQIILLCSASLLLSGCVTLAMTGATAGARVYSQDRTLGNAIDDLAIETRINNLFVQTDIDDLFQNVDADVLEGRVLLTGGVKDYDTALKAVELSWQVKGVREVINEIRMRDKNADISNDAEDLWITTQIEGELLITTGIRSANYNIETEAGVVTLMGIAQDRAELEKVTDIVRRTKGVKKVVSHVMMKDDPRRITPKLPPQQGNAYEQH